MSHKRSNVWQHFVKKSREEAECQSYHKVLKWVGGSTCGLKAHLSKVLSVHGINSESEASVTFNKYEHTLMRFCLKSPLKKLLQK